MGAVAEIEARTVPRKRSTGKPGPADQPPPKRKQYNVGLSPDLSARVDATAAALGLDEVNFLRMLITVNLPKYEQQVEEMRGGPG